MFWNLSWWFLMFWVLINDIIIHVIVLFCVSWSNKSERVETTLKLGAEMISHGNVKFLSIRRTTKHTSGISPEFSLGCILYINIIVSCVSVQDVKSNAFWKPGCQWCIPQVTLYPSTYLNDPRSYSQSFYLGYQRKYPCICIYNIWMSQASPSPCGHGPPPVARASPPMVPPVLSLQGCFWCPSPVCMYVFVPVCMHAYMYVWVYICMYVCNVV